MLSAWAAGPPPARVLVLVPRRHRLQPPAQRRTFRRQSGAWRSLESLASRATVLCTQRLWNAVPPRGGRCRWFRHVAGGYNPLLQCL